MKTRLFRNAPGLVALLLSVQLFAHEEEAVITVGHDAAGKIIPQIEFPQPAELPLSVFPGFPGYATGEEAFHSAVSDDPDQDFFQFQQSPPSDFRFILLAKDPGVEVWNGTAYLGVGDSFFVGPAPFDTHPIWNITAGSPGNTYSLTLMLRDLNGLYSDSDQFILSFTPSPPRPLYLNLTNSSQATIEWTTNSADWVLESNFSPGTTNWVIITNEPTVAGTNFSVTLDATATQQFFRLRKN